MDEILESKRHIKFWVAFQQLTLDAAIMDVCKLYGKKAKNEHSLSRLIDLAKLDIELPSHKEIGTPLQKLFSYRDKALAHREDLSPTNFKSIRELPSYRDLLALINQAQAVCRMCGYDIKDDDYSGRNSTKNVLFDLLRNTSENKPSHKVYQAFMQKSV